MLALKNTARAQRLYKPVAGIVSVRKARNRVRNWSIILLVLGIAVLMFPSWWSMVIFTATWAMLLYRLVGWQDTVQKRWEREHRL